MEDDDETSSNMEQLTAAVARDTSRSNDQNVALLVMSLRDDKLVDQPVVEYNGTNQTLVTRNVVRFAQALNAVDMLTRNYESWSQPGHLYDSLTETQEVIFQGMSLQKTI